ncbi:MAG: ABC transporter substrate-binding protein [Litoreibacter sp.]|nr:ABC transporter substrate-binding protein [Litoreibacter sp.]
MGKSNMIDRRQFSVGLGAAVLSAGLVAPASALTGAQAEFLVKNAVKDINKIIASGKSESRMMSDFERVFTRYADVNIIALTTLGPARRTATNTQILAYTNAFKNYFTQKYGRRFREFVGGEIVVDGSRASKRSIEVKSTAVLKGSAPFEVTWLVSDRSGSPKIFNIIIEGVNTLTSERAEIGAMLDKRGGNIDRLTADLANFG